MGRPRLSFDGGDDVVNVYTSSLASAFNPSEGTLALWAKFDAAALSDGSPHYLAQLQADSNNAILLYKDTSGYLRYFYRAGGTLLNKPSLATVTSGWHQFVLTWSVSGNQLQGYLDGVSQFSVSGLGTWAGALSSIFTCLGSSGIGGYNVFLGNLAYGAVWATPLGSSTISSLATV